MAGFKGFKRYREKMDRIDRKIQEQREKEGLSLTGGIIKKVQARIYDFLGWDFKP